MNNYHIYSEIGRGKGSVVYKGREKKTINYVAIKSVEKAYKKRVMNEVAVLYSLHHPHILRFLNWYETSRHIWLIVEYCTGGDLLAMLKVDQAMPETACKRFAYDILQGLQFLHSKGYIYADLKPSNILVNEYGTLLLCDFGLAKRVAQDRESEKANEENSKRGTPYYMSPELFYSDGINSFASDLWAFGVVMYELATGRPPFYSKSLEEVVTAILESEPAPLWNEERDQQHQIPHDPTAPPHHSFSAEFQHLISRCLEKDPARRITWDELREHPWWSNSANDIEGFHFQLPTLELPDQPLFNQLFLVDVRASGANNSNSHAGTRSSFSGSLRASQQPDVLRLSFQAKKNRAAEQAAAAASSSTTSSAGSSVSGTATTSGASSSSSSANASEIEEELDGDTELNFGDDAASNSSANNHNHPPPSSSNGRPTRPASSTTFREPPRPAQPSELDQMEMKLAQLTAEDDEEDHDDHHHGGYDNHGYDGEEYDGRHRQHQEEMLNEDEHERWASQPSKRYDPQHPPAIVPPSSSYAYPSQSPPVPSRPTSYVTHGERAGFGSDSDPYEDAISLNPARDSSTYYDEEDDNSSARASVGGNGGGPAMSPTTVTPSSQRRSVVSSSKVPVLATRLPASSPTGSSSIKSSPKTTTKTSGSTSSTSSASSHNRKHSVERSVPTPSSSSRSSSRKTPVPTTSSSSSSTKRPKSTERSVPGSSSSSASSSASSSTTSSAASTSRSKKKTTSGGVSASTKPPATAGGARSNKKNSITSRSSAAVSQRPPATAQPANRSQRGQEDYLDDADVDAYEQTPSDSPYYAQRTAWDEQQR